MSALIFYVGEEECSCVLQEEPVLESHMLLYDLRISDDMVIVPTMLYENTDGKFTIHPAKVTSKKIPIKLGSLDTLNKEEKENLRRFIALLYGAVISNGCNPDLSKIPVYFSFPLERLSVYQISELKAFLKDDCCVTVQEIILPKQIMLGYIFYNTRTELSIIKSQNDECLVIDYGKKVTRTYYKENERCIYHCFAVGAEEMTDLVFKFLINCNTESKENYNLIVKEIGETEARKRLASYVRSYLRESSCSPNNEKFMPPITCDLSRLLMNREYRGKYIETDDFDFKHEQFLEIISNHIVRLWRILRIIKNDINGQRPIKIMLIGNVERSLALKEIVEDMFDVSKEKSTLRISLHTSPFCYLQGASGFVSLLKSENY